MPSTSPGTAPTTPSSFLQILPGGPTTALQSISTFFFRQKRYIAYISGRQVNLLSSPTSLIQALTFDDDLIALASESQNGRVVVAIKSRVWLLEPRTEGWTKVWWEKSLLLVREDPGDETYHLSWGNDNEVLVGGSRNLSLFNTLPSSRSSNDEDGTSIRRSVRERRPLWSKSVASPTQYACFSPSGGIIASCGRYDRLVKIWRRLSYEEGLFDYTYLPHPGPVTHLQWRPFDYIPEDQFDSGSGSRHDDEAEVLYTLSTDGILRIWTSGGNHDLDILSLHTTVDLTSGIPQSPSLLTKSPSISQPNPQPARYAFIVPSDQFSRAVNDLIPLGKERVSHSVEHLREMASSDPDVIVSLDGHGRMSAWGLQSVGHKRRPETPSEESKQPFHIAHAERLPLKLPEGANARFETWFDDGKFNVLVHSLSGYVHWWRGNVEEFFSPSAAGSDHLEETAYWSGHQSGPITRLRGSSQDRNVLSCSVSSEIAQWSPSDEGIVHNDSLYSSEGQVLDLISICGGLTVVLEQSKADACKLQVSIRAGGGRMQESRVYNLEFGDDSAEWRLYSSAIQEQTAQSERLIVWNNSGRGFTFTVEEKGGNFNMSALTSVFLPPAPEEQIVSHASVILDAAEPHRVGFVCATKSGSLLLYHLELSRNKALEPALVASFESDIQDPGILAAHNEFAAVVSSDRKSLAIINLQDGYVEQREALGEQIQFLVPAAKNHLLAVGYDTYVNILVQGRYEHFGEMQPWTVIKQVSLAGVGLAISAVSWTGDGGLAIAAGNGIYFSSNDVAANDLPPDIREAIDADPESDETHKLSTLAHRLKTPLPVWHPSLVAHTVRHGHWYLASNILNMLTEKLRFWSEGDDLHPHLGMPTEHLYDTERSGELAPFDQDLANDLMQLLDEKDLPEVSQREQERLKRVVQAMTFCSSHVNALDNGALRFLFSWRFQLLQLDGGEAPNCTLGENETPSETAIVPEMHWREITFAYHSTTQQPLLDVLTAHYDNKISWTIARRLGLFAWLADREALDRIFDSLAQSAYRSSSPADPINASLYFLALHKKPTLLALWRIATWHKEQKATMNFLRRDFTQPQNQTAARKNAYALMGKKRFDYAAAFFLLADDAASATSLLASQCGDIMLAIAVARLYSGDGSPVLRKLLEDRLMPQAREKGDRWLMSWCHAILFEKDAAAEALVQPLDCVRTWLQDDPNTLTLYRRLRKSSSEYEYEAVLRAARILRRMGLWLLALELVSQWEFKPHHPAPVDSMKPEPAMNGTHAAPSSAAENSAESVQERQPPSMLDDYMPPPASAPEDDKAAREAKAAELLKKLKAKKEEPPAVSEKKQEPTQFKEPDANSLLDSFGF